MILQKTFSLNSDAYQLLKYTWQFHLPIHLIQGHYFMWIIPFTSHLRIFCMSSLAQNGTKIPLLLMSASSTFKMTFLTPSLTRETFTMLQSMIKDRCYLNINLGLIFKRYSSKLWKHREDHLIKRSMNVKFAWESLWATNSSFFLVANTTFA